MALPPPWWLGFASHAPLGSLVPKGEPEPRAVGTPASVLPPPSQEGKRSVALPYLPIGSMTPQLAGMVASWGSEGSNSLLPAALKS